MRTVVHRLLGRKTFFIARLLALTVLFFVIVVWLYYAYAPSILRRLPIEIGFPDVVAEESARLDSLGSFLSALFQGNLGYSSHYGPPVWSILAEHLGMTALLIVISIAVSAATGALVASIAARFRQKGHMPLTSAYSLKGYFFSLTTWTGFILLLLFSLNLGWFPYGHSEPDYWIIHPPENVFVEIEGRLMHLALPVLTLAIIFLIRSFFVVWSGSIRFTSGKTLRNLFLPSTVTDFACVISAVVLVEYVYVLPGVGWTLFMSIDSGDLNMLVGAFLMLLAIAIVLGYLGVFSDFVRQRYGLLDESRKEVHARIESKERPTERASNTKLRSLLKLLLGNKSGFLGLILVSAFIIIGLAAPLLTPYDPASIIATPKVAYRLSKPVWYKYLYPNENLSENIDVTSDPSFNSADAINELSLETSLTDLGAIRAEYVSDEGFSEGSGPGCMAIIFSRDAGVAPYGEFTASLTAQFNYPYSFPPQQFSGQVAVLVADPQSVLKDLNVFLEKTGGKVISWSDEDFETHADGWITPYPPADSADPYTKQWLGATLGAEWGKSPEAAMFSQSGEYRFTLEIAFEDTQSGASNVTVFVDDFSMKLYGNSFGLLGTDEYGRDIYSQLLYGARNTLIVAVPTAAAAAIIGLALGFAASNFGNLIDNIVKLFVDTTFALPIVPLLIVATWALGQGSPVNWVLLWMLSALAAMASRMTFAAHKSEKTFVGSARRSQLLSQFKNFAAIFCFSMASLTLLNLISNFFFYSSLLPLDIGLTWGDMLARTLDLASRFYALWLWVPPLSCLILFTAGFVLIGAGIDKRVQFALSASGENQKLD